MTVHPIRVLGDPVLRETAKPVVEFDRALRKLAKDMTQTMRKAPGVGLAAPQIGVALRLFVYDMYDGTDGAVANPELTVLDDTLITADEGCLSFPGVQYPLARYTRVEVHGQDLGGDPITVRPTGDEQDPEYFARCLQHEADHLDGVVYLDKLPRRLRGKALRRGPVTADT
ncbi:MAG: peptide deformylase [Nocardioidaceae bacterium]